MNIIPDNRIAVIMSVYKGDRAEYVRLSIESILGQTYPELDLYIQFDGPVGKDVYKYIDGLCDKRVIVLRREENKGLAQSMNDLLDIVLSKGYLFIARMDADDIAVPDRFEKQLTFLEENPDVDCLGGAINEIDENGKDREKITSYPCSPEETRAFFCKRNPVAHPTVMMRRSLFEKAGGLYPLEFVRNEDTMLWCKAYMGGARIANLPEVVLNFRMTDEMFTNRRGGKDFAKSQLQLRRIINKELGYGPMATVYAYAMFVLMVSPSWLRKIAYRVLR